MSKRKIVAGNWKMNTDWLEAFDLATAIKENSSQIKDVEKILFPPLPFLQMTSVILNKENGFSVGAQNCSEHAAGAYTGEVSAKMIRSSGCDYVLIGHSERRTYFSESAAQLIKKTEQALANGLKIIFCVGEKLEERKSNLHFDTLNKQLKDVLVSFPKDKTDQLILAYEPVWAIGTGETATPQQAQEMHVFIRDDIGGIFSKETAAQIPILYGGSCTPKNAQELFSCPDVEGGLIGGASLKAADFCAIMNSFR